ncbi:Fic family protein [Halomonas sp. C05BenzN]|uniref:Fic family protein n=1 Tax=Halomonas sp. C05BenzN TaxID=3411041 RepID=UPI003B96058E
MTPCSGMSHEDAIHAIAQVHVELILMHSFREGNGRITRLHDCDHTRVRLQTDPDQSARLSLGRQRSQVRILLLRPTNWKALRDRRAFFVSAAGALRSR